MPGQIPVPIVPMSVPGPDPIKNGESYLIIREKLNKVIDIVNKPVKPPDSSSSPFQLISETNIDLSLAPTSSNYITLFGEWQGDFTKGTILYYYDITGSLLTTFTIDNIDIDEKILVLGYNELPQNLPSLNNFLTNLNPLPSDYIGSKIKLINSASPAPIPGPTDNGLFYPNEIIDITIIPSESQAIALSASVMYTSSIDSTYANIDTGQTYFIIDKDLTSYYNNGDNISMIGRNSGISIYSPTIQNIMAWPVNISPIYVVENIIESTLKNFIHQEIPIGETCIPLFFILKNKGEDVSTTEKERTKAIISQNKVYTQKQMKPVTSFEFPLLFSNSSYMSGEYKKLNNIAAGPAINTVSEYKAVSSSLNFVMTEGGSITSSNSIILSLYGLPF